MQLSVHLCFSNFILLYWSLLPKYLCCSNCGVAAATSAADAATDAAATFYVASTAAASAETSLVPLPCPPSQSAACQLYISVPDPGIIHVTSIQPLPSQSAQEVYSTLFQYLSYPPPQYSKSSILQYYNSRLRTVPCGTHRLHSYWKLL